MRCMLRCSVAPLLHLAQRRLGQPKLFRLSPCYPLRMSGSRADSPIQWAVGDSGGVVADNDWYSGLFGPPIQLPEIPAQVG